MTLVKCAAAAVLAGQTDGNAFSQERAESEGFRHPIIEQALAFRHFETLLQKFLHLRMNMESVRVTHDSIADLRQLRLRDSSFDFERRVVAPTLKCAPIAGQPAHR